MVTEFEAQFPGIAPDDIRQKLAQLGATLVEPERLMKRKNYDYPDGRLDASNGWVRLRDEGDKVTLTYKQLQDRTITGTKEASLTINSWDMAERFLEGIGLEMKTYQETKRESWKLGEVEIEIDTWPWVPTFLEIEASNEEEVQSMAAKLGLDWSNAMFGSVENIYQMHFDVTEAEVDDWKEILFIDTPDWLEEKCKKTK